MRSAYFEELEELFEDFLEMSKDVKIAINKSVKAFSENDRELAQQVINEDVKINEQESALIKQSIQMIALEAPVVKDLRRVITVMKSSNDLERMGDHARSVAIAALELDSNTNSGIKKLIEEMGREVENMMTYIIAAMENADSEQAMEHAKRDDIVDDLHHRVRTHVAEVLKDPEASTEVYLTYTTVASHVERIGDYITNIAEQIVYLDTGESKELNRYLGYKEEN